MMRRRWFAPLVAATLLSAGFAPAARAAETKPFVNGSGAASAIVMRERLFYAGYSLAVPQGQSATQYENKQSRALGGAYDLSGVTGLVDQHPAGLGPTSIDSNSGDKTQSTDVGAGASVGHIVLTAKGVPLAHSDIHLADESLGSVLTVKGGHSESSSGVVDGKTRLAEASASVASLSIANGLVAFDGLKWTARHQSGAVSKTEATFTLSKVTVAGLVVARDVHELDGVLPQINAALASVGVVIEAPKVVHHDNGAIDMSAIRIGVINSPLGAKYLGPLIAQIRPTLLPVFDALTKANTTLGLAALVADLGLGAVDGSGGVEMTVGGATAITGDRVFSNPLGGSDLGAPSVTVGAQPTNPGFGALPALPVTAGGATETRQLAASDGGPARCVLAAASRKGSCRGSNAAGAVGLVALAISALAAYDAVVRRRRRDGLEVAR